MKMFSVLCFLRFGHVVYNVYAWHLHFRVSASAGFIVNTTVFADIQPWSVFSPQHLCADRQQTFTDANHRSRPNDDWLGPAKLPPGGATKTLISCECQQSTSLIYFGLSGFTRPETNNPSMRPQSECLAVSRVTNKSSNPHSTRVDVYECNLIPFISQLIMVMAMLWLGRFWEVMAASKQEGKKATVFLTDDLVLPRCMTLLGVNNPVEVVWGEGFSLLVQQFHWVLHPVLSADTQPWSSSVHAYPTPFHHLITADKAYPVWEHHRCEPSVN